MTDKRKVILAVIVVLSLGLATAALALAASSSAPPSPSAVLSPQSPVPVANEYYVTGRYFCIDNSDGSDRGSCDRTTRANSCQEALKAQQDQVNNADSCKYCTEGTTDNTKHWSKRVEWIHLGPCKGYPN
jgi:hypothetical protein